MHGLTSALVKLAVQELVGIAAKCASNGHETITAQALALPDKADAPIALVFLASGEIAPAAVKAMMAFMESSEAKAFVERAKTQGSPLVQEGVAVEKPEPNPESN